jgi:hypothetical protein
MNAKIYIDGELIELGDFSFTLNFSIRELEDVSKRKAFKTSTITVPATNSNLQKFGFPNLVSVRQKTGMTAEIVFKGMSFTGDVVMYGTEKIGSINYINFQVVASSLSEKLQGIMLRDLDLGSFTFNSVNVLDRISAKRDFTFAIFDHDNFREKENVLIVEPLPILNSAYVMEELLNSIGYQLHSDSNLSAKHYLASFDNYLINEENFETKRTFDAEADYSWSDSKTGIIDWWITPTGLSQFQAGFLVEIDFDAINHEGELITTNKYTANTDGAYRFYVSNFFKYQVFSDDTMSENLVVKLLIYKNGSTIETTSKTYPGTQTNNGAGEKVEVDTGFIHLVEGDEIEMLYQLSGRVQAPCAVDILKADIVAIGQADPRRGTGAVMNIADALPNWSAINFVKTYCTFFNYYLMVNEFTREVLILPYAEFYRDTAKDWTENLVTSEVIKVERFGNVAVMDFIMREDNADVFRVKGENESRQLINVEGGSDQQINVDVSFTKFGSAGVIGLPQKQMPVAVSHIRDNVVEREKAGAPWHTSDDNPEYKNIKYNFNTRLLYWDVMESSIDTWHFEGTPMSNWITYRNTELKPSDFKNRYSGQFRNMEFSKVLTASFHIPAYELQNYLILNTGDFRTPIHIDGEFYYLIDIKGWNTDTERATCTLLQINDKDIEL